MKRSAGEDRSQLLRAFLCLSSCSSSDQHPRIFLPSLCSFLLRRLHSSSFSFASEKIADSSSQWSGVEGRKLPTLIWNSLFRVENGSNEREREIAVTGTDFFVPFFASDCHLPSSIKCQNSFRAVYFLCWVFFLFLRIIDDERAVFFSSITYVESGTRDNATENKVISPRREREMIE